MIQTALLQNLALMENVFWPVMHVKGKFKIAFLIPTIFKSQLSSYMKTSMTGCSSDGDCPQGHGCDKITRQCLQRCRGSDQDCSVDSICSKYSLLCHPMTLGPCGTLLNCTAGNDCVFPLKDWYISSGLDYYCSEDHSDRQRCIPYCTIDGGIGCETNKICKPVAHERCFRARGTIECQMMSVLKYDCLPLYAFPKNDIDDY